VRKEGRVNRKGAKRTFMMRKKGLTIFGAALLALGVLLLSSGVVKGSAPRPRFEKSALTITRADGTKFSFKVEVARTETEQTYGLMFVTSLRDDEGMIFPYAPPRKVSFWMKNTLIPLDMLFVQSDGTIGRIAASAQPQDVTPISSQEPVSAVIEINGGLAKKDGFEAGDKVESSILRSQ